MIPSMAPRGTLPISHLYENISYLRSDTYRPSIDFPALGQQLIDLSTRRRAFLVGLYSPDAFSKLMKA